MHVATATHSTAKNIAPESSKLCTQILQILTTASNNLNSEQSVKASRATAVSESSRSNCDTPLSSLASNSGSSSSARVEHFIETDSGKSSCEPILLDESVDSGIMVEFKDLELHKRIQQCQRILKALERDQENYRRLRERLSKISDRKNRKILAVKQEPRCNVCCTELNVKDPKCFVTCGTCNKMICRNISCADWFPKSSQWECQLCYSKKETFSQTSTWVAEQMCFNQQKMIQYPMRARSEIYIPIHDFTENNTMQFDSVSQMGLNCSDISAEQKIKIREYVEELVSNILGGSLDKVAVNQISKSENYMQLFEKYHKKLSSLLLNMEKRLCIKVLKGDLPGIINGAKQEEKENENDFSDISETRLRKLISTIIGETLRLPVLKNATSEKNLRQRSALLNGSVEKHNQYFEPENYQDLLATAVLNRIIEKQHIARILGESAEDLNQTDVDINYNKEDISGSSADPKSDYSYSDEDHNDNESKYKRIHGRESALSDYIASHTVPLPDLTNANTDDEASSSFMGEGTWEDNWLFKKKTLDTSSISGGSRILIPAPKEDIRAQIGDQVADEVSDLSEMGSDTDESSLKKDLDPVNDRLRDKQLIGGNNSKLVLDELMNTSQSITLESGQETENKSSTESDVYPVSDDSTTSYVDQFSNSDDQTTDNMLYHSSANVTNNFEAQNTNSNIKNDELKNLKSNSSPIFLTHEDEIVVGAVTDDDDGDKVDLFRRFVPGSIAEREFKKWNNAVDMPNNPYAPEALKRRISGSGADPLIDLPMISPSNEQNPLAFLKENINGADDERTKMLQKEQEKLRYSRDYYINDDAKKGRSSSQNSPQKLLSTENIDEPDVENVIINEVNAAGTHKIHKLDMPETNNYWTLSTPVVRRSSSLKFINKRHSSPFSPNISSHQRKHEVDKDDDTCSQRSWKSVSVNFGHLSNRNVHSSLSVHSSASNGTSSSSSNKRSLSNANILSQFEKQLLHKDLKRSSFRAVSQTTKDFVMNPLFESEKFYNSADATLNSKLECDTNGNLSTEDTIDSGIDSCLNGYSEIHTTNNSEHTILK